MGFFTRPDLDNREFKQTSGSTLTLSGDTTIVGSLDVTGTLKSKGVEIIGSGGTVGDILTFDGTKIVLAPNSGGTAGSGIYTGSTPSTITVGGIAAGTSLTGRSFTSLWQQLLVQYLIPAFTSFIIDSAGQYEVGNPSAFTGSHNFTFTISNAGNVCSNTFGVYDVTNSSCIASGCAVSSPQSVNIGSVSNTIPISHSWRGDATNTSSNTLTSTNTTITSIYPYFYGKSASGGAGPGINRPTANQALINSGTKVLGTSTGTITISFNTSSDDYMWFAIPSTSTSKTVWYINALNTGAIGGAVSFAGNLFPNFDLVSIDSPTGYWSGVNYKIYIANYQSAVTDPMQLRNS